MTGSDRKGGKGGEGNLPSDRKRKAPIYVNHPSFDFLTLLFNTVLYRRRRPLHSHAPRSEDLSLSSIIAEKRPLASLPFRSQKEMLKLFPPPFMFLFCQSWRSLSQKRGKENLAVSPSLLRTPYRVFLLREILATDGGGVYRPP